MKRWMLAIGLCLCSGLLLAQTPDSQLIQDLDKIKTLKANFIQTVFNNRRVVQRSSGVLEIQRPGGFRWESTRPIHQLIVANKQQLWIYDKDLEQVTIQRMDKGIGMTPAFFLSDRISSIAHYYQVAVAPLGNGIVYTLTPKNPHNSYHYIQLRFEKNALVAMRLNDNLGQTTDLRLSHIQLNQAINGNRFQFAPPKGVDVIKQ